MTTTTTSAPIPAYDEQTGRLFMTDGTHRRVVMRVGKDGTCYVWWRIEGEKGREIPVTAAELFAPLPDNIKVRMGL